MSIPYEVQDNGPLTIVDTHGFVGNLGIERQHPIAAAFLDRLATSGLVRESWGEAEPNTVLATVLYTDVVGSTERVAELGG